MLCLPGIKIFNSARPEELARGRERERERENNRERAQRISDIGGCENTACKLSNILLIVGGKARRNNARRDSRKVFSSRGF